MDLTLEGKIALVTGVTKAKGLGRAIAVTLAKEGADIACLYHTDVRGAESVVEEIRAMGKRAIAIGADQSQYEQVRDAVRRCQTELGFVDILVNNGAMLGVHDLASRIDVSLWDKQLKVNLSGPFYWVKETFGSMAEKKWGRIVSISSITAVLGGFGQPSYSSSKGGLITLMKSIALEGARFGITANAVSLGWIDTDVTDRLNEDFRERFMKRIPMRIKGVPQDVANIVAFLASDRSRYITGCNIILDGGASLFSV